MCYKTFLNNYAYYTGNLEILDFQVFTDDEAKINELLENWKRGILNLDKLNVKIEGNINNKLNIVLTKLQVK